MATKSTRRLSPTAIAVLILALLGVAVVASSGFYTDLLWYSQVGYSKVFTTQLVAETSLFFIGGLAMGLPIALTIFLAYRSRSTVAATNPLLNSYRELFDQLRRAIQWGVPLILAVFAGIAASAQWRMVLVYLNRTPTGTKDPQFGLDASFYMFEMPFWRGLVTLLSAITLLSLVLGLAVHLVSGSFRFTGRQIISSPAARVHIAVTAGSYLLVQAGSVWLDQYSAMTSTTGLYTGATYTDVNASIPGFQILTAISVLVAALFFAMAFVERWRLPILATAALLVSSLILSGIYPWMVQTLQVGPNERTLESVYLKRNIEATRYAYGLNGVETVQYDAKTTATAGALRKDAETTASIRIIDPALVSPSFRQLEQYRQYYDFANQLDVDRYKIEGKSQDTVIAVRELNQSGLGGSQSWVNNTIVYTHGYGLVAAFGNQRSTDGQPVFLQSGIPSSGKLGEFEPRIYFGQQSPTYSIVGSKSGGARELDYPGGTGSQGQTYTTFKGDGGPKLDNLFVRLLYAIKFQSEQILLSNSVDNDSQILYVRDPAERVKKVAPYLTLDSNPYPAVVDGRIQWIVDGYTTSANYPYSRAENLTENITDSHTSVDFSREKVNYIRNSVKATVDAYDGSIKLYAWDDQDPVLKTWQKIFPATIAPLTEMSGDLISHVRYPEDLFKLQRAILGNYHVEDAGAFYSQQDAWMTPNDPTASQQLLQPPYYLTMQVPGQKDPSFSLYTTFIPRSTGQSTRNVLTGYLVADADAGSKDGVKSENYGKLRLLTLPRSTIVPGPGQVQNNFNSDSDVSRLLNILRQGSTRVLNGNLLTLPVGGGLLYVQPVYIQSTGETSFPLLKKVLVSFGDKIAFEDTLNAALDSLFGGSSGASAGDSGANNGGTGGSSGGSTSGTGSTTGDTLAKALQRASIALAAKAKALAAGDWAAYGKADADLKAAVEAAIRLESAK
ncbi:MAG: hypothetical protein RL670_223 [Actinomycetota bacterium]